MAKTLRLLSTYNGNKPGTIVSVSDAIAAQLLVHGNASETLTGGVYDTPPAPTRQFVDRPPVPDPKRRRYLRQPGSHYLTGREASLAPFPFETVAGGTAPNPQKLSAAMINASYAGGVPGVLERVDDAAILTGGLPTTARPEELFAWWLRCQPTHTVIDGRPRAYIQSYPLKFYTHHRMRLKFRPYHKDVIGYFNMGQKMPHSGLWALTQQGTTDPFGFDVDQVSGGASPLYIKQQGAALCVEIRTPAEDMGNAPGYSPDGNGRTYPTWGTGDQHVTQYKSDSVTLDGRLYHEIVIDFFLDPRRTTDEGGGEGYFRGTFDGKPWFSYDGPTSLPPNGKGLLVPCAARLGYYEVSTGTQPAGTLNSDVDAPNGATSVERSILIREYSVLEGS